MFSLLLLALSPIAFAAPTSPWNGPDHAEMDLIRTSPGGPRIFVEATYADGSVGLFLVDTGANISILAPRVAERLGLEVQRDFGSVVGLGGTSSMHRAVLPSMSLGEVELHDVEVAVGVPGMAATAGALDLDGLLGNNIWANFVMEIDYPADRLVLHRPGTVSLGRKASPMLFDGSHIATNIEVFTPEDPKTAHVVSLRLDTGAGDLSFCGATPDAFAAGYTEGLEPILGLGASETLPPYRNLRETRRIPLTKARLAGKWVDAPTARWLDFNGREACPPDLRGLIGHELLAQHRVWFDFQGRALRLAKSHRPKRQIDGHQRELKRELALGRSVERALIRARLHLQVDDVEAAQVELRAALDDTASVNEATVLLAHLLRFRGDVAGALDLLEKLGPAGLIASEEMVGFVNALVFAGRAQDAVALSRQATELDPDDGWAWVALADAHFATGAYAEADAAIRRAVEREAYADAHLLRRARIALASGDRDGSLTHVRRLLHLYPMGGEFLWFYALLVDGGADLDTFRNDLEAAMSRLHEDARPLDFLVAAEKTLGETRAARLHMDKGIVRDCERLNRGHARDNCLAWYWSLAGVNPEESLTRIERALASEGQRPDYLDTLAMVRLAREELPEAVEAARSAARMSPDSVYMVWQAERLETLAGAQP